MYKKVMGFDINYSDRGEGEFVLLLHGWGANITLFEGMTAILEKKYRVLSMDMPGFGQSDEPEEPWCVDDYVDFVLEFLKDYDVKKLTVLGHSFGGRVIIKMCSRDLPFEIDKVILVDSAGVKPEKSASQKTKQGIMNVLKPVYNSKGFQKLFPGLMDSLRNKSGSADYRAASPVMKQTLIKVVNEDLCHLMPNVKAPTLLVWGSADTATPLSDAKKMEQLMPEAGLVVFQGASHYSFLDCAQQFGRVLASFMNIE